MNCRANYYDDGMITVLFGRGRKNEVPLLKEYLSYPQTSQLHIYGITRQNYETVLALVRFAKSLYNFPIFCYYDKVKMEVQELPFLCEKTIHCRS